MRVRGRSQYQTIPRPVAGRKPEYRAVDNADQEIAAVAEAIEELHKDGYRYRDQAILSAGNDRVSCGGPPEVHDGRHPSQHLLDRGRNVGSIVDQTSPLLRMFEQRQHAAGDQGARRLAPRVHEQ